MTEEEEVKMAPSKGVTEEIFLLPFLQRWAHDFEVLYPWKECFHQETASML